MKDLEKIVYEYPTESKYGFTEKEIKELLKQFPKINMDKYYDAMMGNTCMLSDKKEIINYHCDVYTAISCGIENRGIKSHEWD